MEPLPSHIRCRVEAQTENLRVVAENRPSHRKLLIMILNLTIGDKIITNMIFVIEEFISRFLTGSTCSGIYLVKLLQLQAGDVNCWIVSDTELLQLQGRNFGRVRGQVCLSQRPKSFDSKHLLVSEITLESFHIISQKFFSGTPEKTPETATTFSSFLIAKGVGFHHRVFQILFFLSSVQGWGEGRGEREEGRGEEEPEGV